MRAVSSQDAAQAMGPVAAAAVEGTTPRKTMLSESSGVGGQEQTKDPEQDIAAPGLRHRAASLQDSMSEGSLREKKGTVEEEKVLQQVQKCRPPSASAEAAAAPMPEPANDVLNVTSPSSRSTPDVANALPVAGAEALMAGFASKSALVSFKKSILPISKFVVVVPAEILSRVLFGSQQQSSQALSGQEQEGQVHPQLQQEQQQQQQHQVLKDLEQVLVKVVKDGVEEGELLQVHAEKMGASSRRTVQAGNSGVNYRWASKCDFRVALLSFHLPTVCGMGKYAG
jgi:hypothetical protein